MYIHISTEVTQSCGFLSLESLSTLRIAALCKVELSPQARFLLHDILLYQARPSLTLGLA